MDLTLNEHDHYLTARTSLESNKLSDHVTCSLYYGLIYNMHFVITKMSANNTNGLFCIISLLFTLEDEYEVFHTLILSSDQIHAKIQCTKADMLYF